MRYIPLNIKTHYEVMNSMIKISDLISFALKNEINALGITDSSMFSTMDFYKECIKNGIKPIVGVEITIDELKFILYIKNYDGYSNLCSIVTKNNMDKLSIKDLKKYSNNLICVANTESYKILKDIYEDIYICYFTKEEKMSALTLSSNIVYMNKILTLKEEDIKYLEYLYMIKDGKTIDDVSDYNFKNNYFNEPSELDAQTTIDFANNIDFELPKFEFKLPVYSDNSLELLKNLCKKGINKRLNNAVTEEYASRLKYEIDVISSMGYTDYFLIVYDYVLYAKKNGILVGPGRGSAASSLVSYSLGITEIDPLKYNLMFERFLNPERISMPDIDIDFEYLRRDEVIEYVKNKYGLYNTANIITFGTLLPKQVLRDMGRVLNIDNVVVDRLCKTIKPKDTFKLLKENKEFLSIIKYNDELKNLVNISYHLENLKRHTSIHAAGVVISNELLTRKMPLYKSGDNLITCYTMEYMEELGLLKMDFLGLKNLTIIDNVVKSIEKDKKIKLDLVNVPLNDKGSINIFKEVNTIGIFQFESNGMKSFLKELDVNNFNDIVASIALYRPGPREMIPEYIRRKNKKARFNYLLPVLQPILKDTYGIMIYQEQILEILRVVGGYSYAEADNIRRAMSKKKEVIIIKEKENFISRAYEKGYDKKITEEIYNQILKFANYGFVKSHAVAYSKISFQMAYLKSNYSEYFMVSLLNMVIGSEVKTKEYVDEAKTLGLSFSSIDINNSYNTYKTDNGKIVFPFSVIKSIGSVSSNEIINERSKGKFIDFIDFVKRTYGKINKNIIENLIYAGSFDSFKISRKTMIENLDVVLNYASLCSEIDEKLILKPDIDYKEEYDDEELMNQEYKLFGFYMYNHPVTKYKRDNMVTINHIDKYFDKFINSIVFIENIKIINTKNNERMAFLTVSDEYGKIECVLFPKSFENSFIEKGDIIKILAKVERRMSNYQLIIQKIEKLNKK